MSKDDDDDDRAKAVELRTEHRLSFSEILQHVSVSKSTLSRWLKDYPLDSTEHREKYLEGQRRRSPGKTAKSLGKPSRLYLSVDEKRLTRRDKAHVAEAAVLLRLCLHGFSVYGSPFDGDLDDWIVRTFDGKLFKVQVKWAKRNLKHGLPIVSLVHQVSGESVRYVTGDFDFLIAYCLYTDSVYIWSFEELEGNKTSVTINDEAREAWSKLSR